MNASLQIESLITGRLVGSIVGTKVGFRKRLSERGRWRSLEETYIHMYSIWESTDEGKLEILRWTDMHAFYLGSISRLEFHTKSAF